MSLRFTALFSSRASPLNQIVEEDEHKIKNGSSGNSGNGRSQLTKYLAFLCNIN